MPVTPALEWGLGHPTPVGGGPLFLLGPPPVFLNCVVRPDSPVDQDRLGQRTSSPEPMVVQQPWAFILTVRRSIRGFTAPESTQ